LNTVSELDQYIEQVRIQFQNVGAAIAVVQGGDILYARGFGARTFGEVARVNSHTLFQIGSTTKAFSATALAMLVEEGKVRWDIPVIDVIPEFRLSDPERTEQVTIRDLVSHRTGMADDPFPFLGIMGGDNVIGKVQYLKPKSPFRDSFEYSNLIFGLMGPVIERVSGMTWQAFIACRILGPLKMKRSGTSPYEFWDDRYVASTFLGYAPGGLPDPADADKANLAMPHVVSSDGSVQMLAWQSYDFAAASGALVSSAAEMANWLLLNLNDGNFDGRRLLGAQSLRELHATQNAHAGAQEFPLDAGSQSYAMGWRRSHYHGEIHLAHGGGMLGFPSYAALLPNRRLGVVVLSNGSQPVREFQRCIAFGILDRFLSAPSVDWSREFLDQAAESYRNEMAYEDALRRSLPSNPPSSLSIDRYAGVYESPAQRSARIDVSVTEGRLTFGLMGSGAYSAVLEHWQGDVFRVRSKAGVDEVLGPTFVTFCVDHPGGVIALSVFDHTFQRLPNLIAESH
jgi:CubicO group peptidase (beta-lactamase class C family)